ncbi:MAG: hypothetical protein KAU31_11005, partial [Spirochaetaceae bacterium]|nr:hypothetical protein [Spirochaetaceae bacterium]
HRYWPAFCEMTQECISQAGITADQIRGLAVSSALPSLVMIDRDGQPINNAYNLMDRRAKEEVQWIKDNIGEQEIFRISGNRLDDHPVLVNLMWEKRNRPRDYERVYKALTIEGYIGFRLT